MRLPRCVALSFSSFLVSEWWCVGEARAKAATEYVNFAELVPNTFLTLNAMSKWANFSQETRSMAHTQSAFTYH